MGFHDSLVPLDVCAGWASKVSTQEKGYIKVSYSVVAEGTCVWGGGVQKPSDMAGIAAISLI